MLSSFSNSVKFAMAGPHKQRKFQFTNKKIWEKPSPRSERKRTALIKGGEHRRRSAVRISTISFRVKQPLEKGLSKAMTCQSAISVVTSRACPPSQLFELRCSSFCAWYSRCLPPPNPKKKRRKL